MKNFIYIFIALIAGTSVVNAKTADLDPLAINRYNGQRYIFMEDGIEFSVYPDGEFDFVVPQVISGLNINLNAGAVNISYNSGFNYDAYVQYDQYGAVIQIGNVPIYYDNWGRIVQAGDIYLNYSNARLVRLGGLNIYYRGGNFAYANGYINRYNRSFNPGFYADYLYRPYVDRCLVYTNPYRRYYLPKRYSYRYHRDHYREGYRDGYANAYHDFKRPHGQIAHNSGRRGSYAQARKSTISRTARTTRTSRGTTSRATPILRTGSERSTVSRSTPRSTSTTSARKSSPSTHKTLNSRSTRSSEAQRPISRSSRSVRTVTKTPTRTRATTPIKRSSRTTTAPQRSTTRSTQRAKVSKPQHVRSVSPARSTTRSSRSGTVSRSSRRNN